MNTQVNKQSFLVGGASSGFGLAISQHLIAEGAKVLGVARTAEKLYALENKYKDQFIAIPGDLSNEETISNVKQLCIKHAVSGALINAGGPPVLKFTETSLNDWDNAYTHLLRWKVDLTQQLLPHFKKQGYGRLVYIESSSVKQPIENLVLSTSLRLAVVGMVKTLSQEEAGQGITFNILAPGSHDTQAIHRVIQKKADNSKRSFEQAKAAFLETMPSGKLGDPNHFASLALWLLSPLSEFVNGQVFALEGGVVKSTL